MSTAADRFREIDNLAGEARRLFALGRDDPTSRSARGYMSGVQLHARDGLREAIADQPKLAAFDGLLASMEHIQEYWNGNENHAAMADALDHILNEVAAALANATKQTGEPT